MSGAVGHGPLQPTHSQASSSAIVLPQLCSSENAPTRISSSTTPTRHNIDVEDSCTAAHDARPVECDVMNCDVNTDNITSVTSIVLDSKILCFTKPQSVSKDVTSNIINTDSSSTLGTIIMSDNDCF